MKLCKPWILKFLSWGFVENGYVMSHESWLVQHHMQTYILYIWLLLMWKLIIIYFWTGSKLESGKLQSIKIKWRVNSFFFFWLCVWRVLDLLVTKINNKKTNKIFKFRPTKIEKFKLMTPWFMRVFFFFFG